MGGLAHFGVDRRRSSRSDGKVPRDRRIVKHDLDRPGARRSRSTRDVSSGRKLAASRGRYDRIDLPSEQAARIGIKHHLHVIARPDVIKIILGKQREYLDARRIDKRSTRRNWERYQHGPDLDLPIHDVAVSRRSHLAL